MLCDSWYGYSLPGCKNDYLDDQDTGLCVWGKIVEYFGAFLTISACVYAPLAALLFVDFFFVRKQKLDFYSAYEIKGHDTYRYTKGFNMVGMVCLFVGIAISLLIYNPVTGEVHSEFFFCFTPTGCSLLGTGLLYYLLCKLPPVRRYVRKDISVSPDTKPFDRMKEPPKQNLFLLWVMRLTYCKNAIYSVQ